MRSVPGPHTRAAHARRTRAAHPNSLPQGTQPGDGERLNSDAPDNGDRSPPPPKGTSHHTQGIQCLRGHESQGASAGSPSLHDPTHNMWAANPDCLPQGQAAGGERAPLSKRRSQRHEMAFPGIASCHPHRFRTSLEDCALWGWCRAPISHLSRPESEGIGPRLPAQRTGSRGIVIA